VRANDDYRVRWFMLPTEDDRYGPPFDLAPPPTAFGTTPVLRGRICGLCGALVVVTTTHDDFHGAVVMLGLT
jgi:hypothetical protein